MIISASRRTDIPACLGAWFMERVRAGGVDVANPFNARQVSRIALTPAAVEAVVFWTKNPAPFLAQLAELDRRGFRYGFLFTLNDYGPELEPGVPPLAERVATFRQLARRLGANRLVWRYDPIILSARYPADWHLSRFAYLADALRGGTGRVVVSYLDWYRKTTRALERLEQAGVDRYVRDAGAHHDSGRLTAGLAQRAAAAGLTIQSCAEDERVTAAGIPPGGCLDAAWLRSAFDLEIVDTKHRGQRPLCRCVPSRDIGTAFTCRLGCRYCYAGARGQESVVSRQRSGVSPDCHPDEA